MTTPSIILDSLEKAVLSQDPDLVDEIFHDETVLEMNYEEMLDSLTRGLDEARKKLGDMSFSVGDFLLSVDAVRRGLAHLKGRNLPEGQKKKRAVTGVATGEVHNLGIHIISGIMEALGYEVKCLEQDTDADQFLKELKENNASFLGISSMMSTTLEGMRDIIVRCKREMPHVKIIVGGACMDERMAASMGADCFVKSAVDLPKTLEKLDVQETYTKRYMDYENKVQTTEYHVASAPDGEP
ncbi:MAG: cobalamin-dependent protein [Thermodesulfobacteriota bacterium]